LVGLDQFRQGGSKVKLATYRVKIEFVTPCLGSQPTRDLATQYLAKKHGFAIAEDEVESLPDALEQATTVFHRFPGNGDEVLGLYDYQIKGFLKAAGQVLNGQLKMTNGKPLRALRSKVVKLVFVSPRRIPLSLPEGGEGVDVVERPLRAQTAQGERVALARSESVPEGTWFRCGLTVFPGQITEEVLVELLDYGFYQGLGQWRGGGYGRFRYELTREE